MIFEAVFTLQRTYSIPKADIASALLPLIELPGMVLTGKRRFRVAFDYYVNLNIAFGDAYHAALMQSLKLTEIVTFDGELDRVEDVTRLEP